MAGLFFNVVAFSDAIAGKIVSTDRRTGKSTLAQEKQYAIVMEKSPNSIFNCRDIPCHQWNNELNYVGHSGDLKHNLVNVLTMSSKGTGFTKAIDRSSGMLTNTVCRN